MDEFIKQNINNKFRRFKITGYNQTKLDDYNQKIENLIVNFNQTFKKCPKQSTNDFNKKIQNIKNKYKVMKKKHHKSSMKIIQPIYDDCKKKLIKLYDNKKENIDDEDKFNDILDELEEKIKNKDLDNDAIKETIDNFEELNYTLSIEIIQPIYDECEKKLLELYENNNDMDDEEFTYILEELHESINNMDLDENAVNETITNFEELIRHLYY